MVNVVEHHTGQIIRHKSPPLPLLKELCLALIATKKNLKPKIAFFIPEDGLGANFGEIPELLSQMGNEVCWFYGQPKHFQNGVPENSFLIIDDMITNVRNIDLIVTATVMDCLPKTTKNVLIDHISFAPLQLEHKVNSIYNLSYSVSQSFNSKDEVVAEFRLHGPVHLVDGVLLLVERRLIPRVDLAGVIQSKDHVLKLGRHRSWVEFAELAALGRGPTGGVFDRRAGKVNPTRRDFVLDALALLLRVDEDVRTAGVGLLIGGGAVAVVLVLEGLGEGIEEAHRDATGARSHRERVRRRGEEEDADGGAHNSYLRSPPPGSYCLLVYCLFTRT